MLKIFFYVWSKSRSTMMNLATFDRFFPGNNYNPENKNPQRSPLKPRLDLSLQNSSRQKQKIIFSLLFLFFILPTPLLCAFMKMPDFLKTQKAKDAAQKAKEAKAADKIAELNTEAARRLDVRSKELEARKNALEKRKSQIEANDKTINELENKAKNNNPQLTTQEQQSLENLKKEKEIFEREKKQLDADTKALEQAKDSASVVQQAETEKPATDQNEQDAIDLVAQAQAEGQAITDSSGRPIRDTADAVTHIKMLKKKGYNVEFKSGKLTATKEPTTSTSSIRKKVSEIWGTPTSKTKELSKSKDDISPFSRDPIRTKTGIKKVQQKVTDYFTGQGFIQNMTSGFSTRTDELGVTSRKTIERLKKAGGETEVDKAYLDKKNLLLTGDILNLQTLSTLSPNERRASIESRVKDFEKQITNLEQQIRNKPDGVEKDKLMVQRDALKESKDYNQQLKNLADKNLTLFKVPLTDIKIPSPIKKPDLFITYQLNKEAKNAREKRAVLQKGRAEHAGRPPITQKELDAADKTIKELESRLNDTEKKKIPTQERDLLVGHLTELKSLRDEAVARRDNMSGTTQGGLPPAAAAEFAVKARKANLEKTEKTIEDLNKKIQETSDPEVKKNLQRELKTQESILKKQKKLAAETPEQIKQEIEKREARFGKTMKNFLNLQSGKKWSKQKKYGVVYLALGLGLMGTLAALVASTNMLDTPDVGDEFGGGLYEGSGPGLAASVSATGAVDLKNDQGYFIMGDFADAKIDAASGPVTPLVTAQDITLSPEQIIQKTVSDLSVSQAFGRALSNNEQQEVVRLLTQMQQEAAALQALKTTKQAAKEKNALDNQAKEKNADNNQKETASNQISLSQENKKYLSPEELKNDPDLSDEEKSYMFTASELARLKSHKQTLRQLTCDLFIKELSIRYSKDDDSLLNNYDCRTTIAALNELKDKASQEWTTLGPKITVLQNALNSQKYLSDEAKRKEIADALEKAQEQQKLLEAQQKNITNEVLYLTLQRKRLSNEMSQDDIIKTLRDNKSFARDLKEPYTSSKNRRLTTVLSGEAVAPEKPDDSYKTITRR